MLIALKRKFSILNRTFLIAAISLCWRQMAVSQYNETIRSGRPGQSIGSFTVGQRVFQVQSGIDLSSQSYPGGDAFTIGSENVFRYGIWERFEVSSVLGLRRDQIDTESTGETDYRGGVSNVQIGARYHVLSSPGGLWPSVGVQARVRLPLVGDDYAIDHIAPVMVLITGQRLPFGCSLITNWIVDYDGNRQSPNYRYTFNVGFPVADKVNGFVELFGQLGQDFDVLIDGGFSYLINPDLQLDVSGGYGKNENVSDLFISLGVSWRTLFR